MHNYLGGSFAKLHCLGSGTQFELLGSWLFRIALNAVKIELLGIAWIMVFPNCFEFNSNCKPPNT